MNQFGLLLDAWLTHPLNQRWALTLMHFLWQGLAVGAVYLVLLPLVNRQSSHLRYAWSLVCLALIALLPLVTFAVVTPLNRVPRAGSIERRAAADTNALPAAQRRAAPSAFERPVSIVASIEPQPQEEGGSRYTSIGHAAVWPDLLVGCQTWCTAAWLVGVSLLGARLALGGAVLMRLRGTAVALPHEWLVRAEQVRRRVGTTRRVTFATSARIGEAFATGLLRPMVVLPTCWLTQLSPAMLEAVVAHELAHIRRGDLWVNLAQRIVETVLFYHPVVWWISAAARREREKCCDAVAVNATGDRIGYVETLEHLAARRFSGAAAACPLAAGMGDNQMHLLDRVRYLLGVPAERQSIRPSLISLLMVLLLIAAWRLTSTPQAIVAGEPDQPEDAVALFDAEQVQQDDGHDDLQAIDVQGEAGHDQSVAPNPKDRNPLEKHVRDAVHEVERMFHQTRDEASRVRAPADAFDDRPPRPALPNSPQPSSNWNLTEADLRHQLGEMRQIVERQNRIIVELTRKLEGTASSARALASHPAPVSPSRPDRPSPPDTPPQHPNLPTPPSTPPLHPIEASPNEAFSPPNHRENEAHWFAEERNFPAGQTARFEEHERVIVAEDHARAARAGQQPLRGNNPIRRRHSQGPSQVHRSQSRPTQPYPSQQQSSPPQRSRWGQTDPSRFERSPLRRGHFPPDQYPARESLADQLAAAMERTRREIQSDQRKLKSQQREAESRARALKEQLVDIHNRIDEEASRHQVVAEEREVDLQRQLTTQQREHELEAARLEIAYAREELAHRRDRRRAEHELADLEDQLADLEGDKKREAARRISDLRVVVETADEELALAKREKELEIEMLQAKADRDKHQLRYQIQAEHQAEVGRQQAEFRKRHELVESQLSNAKRESQAALARLKDKIAERQAVLEELMRKIQSEEPRSQGPARK